MANTIRASMTTTKATYQRSESKIDGRPPRSPSLPPENQVHVPNSTPSMSWPTPNVASARNRPDSRSAGTAMTTPSGTTTSPDSSSASGNGTPASTKWT